MGRFKANLITGGGVFPDLRADFSVANANKIVSLAADASKLSPDTLGVEVDEVDLMRWKPLSSQLTNIVYMLVKTDSTQVSESLLQSIIRFKRLEFLHLQCRNAREISAGIASLTNVHNLRYLGIQAPSATRIDRAIYCSSNVEELWLYLTKIDLPSGVSQMSHLDGLEVWSRRTNSVQAFPPDLMASKIKYLGVFNVSNVDLLLPVLPPDLRQFDAMGCTLKSLPARWLNHTNLHFLRLDHDHITVFPADLSRLPALRLLSLDLNDISIVPPLQTQNTNLCISLVDNPLRRIAPVSERLIDQYSIQKYRLKNAAR